MCTCGWCVSAEFAGSQSPLFLFERIGSCLLFAVQPLATAFLLLVESDLPCAGLGTLLVSQWHCTSHHFPDHQSVFKTNIHWFRRPSIDRIGDGADDKRGQLHLLDERRISCSGSFSCDRFDAA